MDDLTRINGIGKATAERLAAAGIDSFEKLAHDCIAGEHGVKVEWIAEAARLHHENTQEKPPRSNDDEGTVNGAPAASGVGDPHIDTQGSSGTAREASSTGSGTTAETPSVGVQPGFQPNTSQGDDQGGTGNPAGPAGGISVPNANDLKVEVERAGASRPHLTAPKAMVIGEIDFTGMTEAEAEAAGADMIAEGRRRYPHLAAAVDAWRETHGDEAAPQGIRITSRRDGFRRCNMDHTRAATDHSADRFSPEELERLLAEPMLTVELV